MAATLPILLLAAGSSTRMRGADKLLEDVDGTPLIRRQAALARRVTSGEVIVALPPRPHPRYAALEGLDVTCLEVTDAAEGMNATLRSAIAALPQDAPAALVMLADMPDLTGNDIKTVLQAVDLTSDTLVWRGADRHSKQGHPIVFAAALFPEFAYLTGDTGGREVVAKAGDRVAFITLPDSDARADLDTPEDWADWRKNRKR